MRLSEEQQQEYYNKGVEARQRLVRWLKKLFGRCEDADEDVVSVVDSAGGHNVDDNHRHGDARNPHND